MQALYLVQSGEQGGGSCQQADCGLDVVECNCSGFSVIGVEVLSDMSAGKSCLVSKTAGSNSSYDSDQQTDCQQQQQSLPAPDWSLFSLP